MLRRHAVVRPEQPRIEVPERDMDHREVLVSLSVVPTDGQSLMAVAESGQRLVPDPRVRPYFCTWHHGCLHEGYQRFLLPVRNDL